MDDRSRLIRWAAWALARWAKMLKGLWRGVKYVGGIFGGQYAVMNLMAVCVSVCFGLLLWWGAIEQIVPMYFAEVVSPKNSYLVVNRDVTQQFEVVRYACMSRGAWGHVSSFYIGTDGAGLEYKISGKESLFFPIGCHYRTRINDVPFTLPPGAYKYRVSLEFCNKLRCEESWVQDIKVVLVGRWPPSPESDPKALREPF